MEKLSILNHSPFRIISLMASLDIENALYLRTYVRMDKLLWMKKKRCILRTIYSTDSWYKNIADIFYMYRTEIIVIR